MDNTDQQPVMQFEPKVVADARMMYRRVLACWAGELLTIRARGLDVPRRGAAFRGWPAAATPGTPIAGEGVEGGVGDQGARAVPAWRPERRAA